MSAEGKKKRGASGLAKAQSEPFRLNGFAPDWQARARGCYQTGPAASGGSTLMRGMLGGALVEALGYGPSRISEQRMAHALTRVTHPLLTLDDEPIREAAQ